MNHKIGRNAPCPCGSGKKYKKCCMQRTEDQRITCAPWMGEEGMHVVGKGTPPSPEEQERMTIKYQEKPYVGIADQRIWERESRRNAQRISSTGQLNSEPKSITKTFT